MKYFEEIQCPGSYSRFIFNVLLSVAAQLLNHGSANHNSRRLLGSSGNWSKRPKVMSHEVMSPETRVKSPEMLSHVARILSGENKECV